MLGSLAVGLALLGTVDAVQSDAFGAIVVQDLVHEDGAWRFCGNAGDAPQTAPATSTPHHPLF